MSPSMARSPATYPRTKPSSPGAYKARVRALGDFRTRAAFPCEVPSELPSQKRNEIGGSLPRNAVMTGWRRSATETIRSWSERPRPLRIVQTDHSCSVSILPLIVANEHVCE